MIFENEQYKYIKVVAPNLPIFAKFMSRMSVDIDRGSIEFLLRAVRKLNFEGIIAHPPAFKAEWEEMLQKNSPLTSMRYEFLSAANRAYKLDEFVSQATTICNSLDLRSEINVSKDKNYFECYHIKGWIEGPMRNGLAGFFYLRDNLGRGIGITGTLSYR